jgi:hypothetical protein
MGRAWGLGVLAIAAGCGNSKPGIVIDVPLDRGHAELFVPVEPCAMTCAAGITPAGATSPLATGGDAVSFLDSSTRWSAHDSDGYARFELEAGDLDHVSAIYVVGFDDSDRPTQFAAVPDVHVPRDGGEHWRVELESATFGPTPATSDDTIWVWRAAAAAPYQGDPAHASCLAIAHGDGTSEAFVPQDDPDCDGLATNTPLECNPLWFEYRTPPTTNQFCTTTVDLNNGAHACEVGQSSDCVDGFGKACGTFPLHPFCVPDAACATLCSGAYDSSCVDHLKSDGANVPRIECRFPVDSAGAPCVAANTAALDLGPVLGAVCARAGFTTGAVADTPMASLGLPAGSPGLFISVGGANPPACALSFTWSGTSTTTNASGAAMFEIDATGGGRIVVPFSVMFTGTCGVNAAGCQLVQPATEQVWQCGN